MNNSDEIKNLIYRQARAWQDSDSAKIIADFADNSLFVVGQTRLSNKQEIKESAEDYFAQYTNVEITINRIIIDRNEVAVEWVWRDTNKNSGEKSYAEDAIIFTLEGNKINYWREYIDRFSPEED